MPAYVIADVVTTNLALMDEYRKQVAGTIRQYGGRYIVRSSAHQTLEGDWRPSRLVIIEFPSLARARRWYDSEPHKDQNALRLKAGRTSAVIVEGV